jgi:hypothetical protein
MLDFDAVIVKKNYTKKQQIDQMDYRLLIMHYQRFLLVHQKIGISVLIIHAAFNARRLFY